MNRTHHRRKGPRDVTFAVTPLIDVVFLLIIFFVLVSNFAAAENVAMELPNPHKSQAQKAKLRNRVIINCQLEGIDDEIGTVYRVGPNPPETLDRIARRLAKANAAAEAEGKDLIVVVRADRRLPFEDVRAAMQVAANQEIEQLRLVAHVGDKE